MTFSEYIQGLKPTASGAITVLFCLFVIPFIADLFFLTTAGAGKIKTGINMSSALFHGYLRMLPYYIIYILLYFSALLIVNHILKSIHLEKFCFRS